MASWVRSLPPLPRRAIRARSSEGVGPGSIPFAYSPAGGGDDARPPRWLAVVVNGFVLFPGSRHRGGDGGWREAGAHFSGGPGFFASPILVASFQSWLRRSLWVASSSCFHRMSSSRRGPVVMAAVACRFKSALQAQKRTRRNAASDSAFKASYSVVQSAGHSDLFLRLDCELWLGCVGCVSFASVGLSVSVTDRFGAMCLVWGFGRVGREG
jgi:hypothetical protein